IYHQLIYPKFWRLHAKSLLLGALALGVVLGGGLTYHWQAKRQAQTALKALRECALLYKRALVANKTELWLEVEAAAKGAYSQAPRSNLAPYFLIYQLQALKQQGKTSELAELIRLALKKVSVRSPLYPNFKLIEILQLVDTKEPQKIAQATTSLAKLARSTTFGRDLVLFYLGELYSFQGQPELAKQAYTELVQEFKLPESSSLQVQQVSPWVKLATERLHNL
ncbi:MAG TPA: hypothetical protein VJJ83_04475, partial [Candidatus Babeliales bacterium]|nr:hypothetical protein [Candidatus Babeliales bacterium]